VTAISSLSGHIVFSTLDKTNISLETLENNEDFLKDLDEYAIQSLNRVRAILNHLSTKLNSIDPALYRKNILDALHNELSNLTSQLNNGTNTFINHSNLNTLNTRVDNIINHTSQILTLFNEESIENILETVTTLRRSVGQYKTILEREQTELTQESENIIEKLKSFEETLNEYDDRISTGIQNIEDKYNQQQQIFLDNQESRSEQFIDLKEEFKQEFNDILKKYEDDIQLNIDSTKTEFQELISTLTTEQEEFLQMTKEKQEQYSKMLEDHKKSVESLVGIISTNSISGHFKEVADKKEKLTTLWQRLTVTGFAVTIGFGVYAFIFSKDLDWPSLVARLIVTTALGSFTAYAARQVTKNEAREKYNRQMEVELKTLNPYIATFSVDDQIKLKEQLFPLIFGKAEVNSPAQDTSTNPTTNQLNAQDLTNAIEVLKSISSSPNKPA
jgi:DNA repair exonuclease SbcCD ATPase subunit